MNLLIALTRRFLLVFSFYLWAPASLAAEPASTFKVICFYTGKNDQAHISFVKEAHQWFANMAVANNFSYEKTDRWEDMTPEYLAKYQVVVFLDSRPEDVAQRNAFQSYIEKGGAWMGFHFSGFTLNQSKFPQNWDWYHNTFLGSGEYRGNTWKPTSAILHLDLPDHPSTTGLPPTFSSSANEWYRWEGQLRQNPDIKVLVSIDPGSFPLGTGPKQHEIWYGGDYPVVWTNQKFHMVYFNMGHNDIDYSAKPPADLSHTFDNTWLNRLVLNSLLWLGRGEVQPDPSR